MGKKFIRLIFLWAGILLPLVLIAFGGRVQKKGRWPSQSIEKPFVIVIPSYNNARYCEQNLLSVLGQEYQRFRVIYTDDASTDETWDKVKALVGGSPLKDRITLIRHEKNRGSLRNLYEMIHMCGDDEIVVRVDGDDFLAHPFVLKKLNRIYADLSIWMTYGNYLDYPSYRQHPRLCEAFPAHVLRGRRFRQHKWVSTHLHTFYAGLFKKISIDHLKKEGEFLPMAGDLAIVFPMLEMAGDHFHFVDEVLYLYNRLNPINDHKKNRQLQSQCESYVRSLPSYSPLKNPPYLMPQAVQ